MSCPINEPLRFEYQTLAALAMLETKFVQSLHILEATICILERLHSYVESMTSSSLSLPSNTISAGRQIQAIRQQCISYAGYAGYLLSSVQITSQLVRDGLNSRQQVVNDEQSGHMLKLNKPAIFITMLAVFYLPASFVSVSITSSLAYCDILN